MKKPTNANELNEYLLDVLSDVRSGALKPVIAVEINNAAGKLINNVKNQMMFAVMQGEEPNIPFLKGSTTGKPSELGLMKRAKFLK